MDLKSASNALKQPSATFYAAVCKLFGRFMSDKFYLSLLYKMTFGSKLNWEHPSTFSEKLQWLKLYNRRPEYTTMVDKAAVKKYVADIIGEEYIIPTLGIWDRPEDIEWEKLPNRFVLKCTHDSHSVIIVKDKEALNKEEACKKLAKSLKNDFYRVSREWPYKNVPHRILAEAYLEPKPDTNDLPDYKFFCFNGEPKFCQVVSGRGSQLCFDFFDKDWVHQSFHEPRIYPFAETEPSKPKNFEKMLDLARQLASDKPFARIDFYDLHDNVYFGEITFFPAAGMGGFAPEDYDGLLGAMITLPGCKWGG